MINDIHTMKPFSFMRPALLLSFVLTSGMIAAVEEPNDNEIDKFFDSRDIEHTRFADSLKQYLKVQPLSEKREMELCLLLAGHYHYKNHDSSVYYSHKSMAIALKLKDDSTLTDIYINLGVTHSFASNYDSAFIYFDRMQVLAASRKDKWNEIKAITMLGYVYSKQGKYHTAIEYYQKVLPVIETEGWNNRNVGALANLGEMNRRIGNTEVAISYLKQAE